MDRWSSFWVVGLAAATLLSSLSATAARAADGHHSAALAIDDGEDDQAIDLNYVCGNRFVITNAEMSPAKVQWRVAGSGESGTVALGPKPGMHSGFSDARIEVHSGAAVEVMAQGRRVAFANNGRVPCPSQATATALAASTPEESAAIGEWSAPIPWHIVAVHLQLLPDGRVMSFGRVGSPQVWDPTTGTFTAMPSPSWLFCSGHAFLPDGRLLVAGGHIRDTFGIPDTNLYSNTTGWTKSSAMSWGRWYPTVTIMGNGEAVITAGTDRHGANVPIPEVWNNGSIRALTGASKTLPWYPRAFLAPNGKLFYAGSSRSTGYLDTKGTGKWTTVGDRRYGSRAYGGAVMYEPGKILYAGGGLTTNTAETIDLNQAAPAWTFTGSMAFARRHHNLTLLPTGEVLATAGVAGSAFNDLTQPVYAAEIWNSATGTWRPVASSAVPRGYHGTALLLPDGRVLEAGSGDSEDNPDQLSAELYSPAYLFAGPRPTISSVPASVRYGAKLRVSTPDPASIAKISLIRLGAVTHAFDQNTRYRALNFTADATGLLTSITNRNLTPPGHYMLFIVDQTGVPSIASIIKVK